MSELTLPPFPVDESTLNAVEHALDAALDFDEDGNTRLVGAEYSLITLLDFLSGAMGDDPSAEVLDPGDPLAVDDPGIPPFLRGLAGAAIVLDSRPRYSEHDVIRALIGEIQRLRSGGGEDNPK